MNYFTPGLLIPMAQWYADPNSPELFQSCVKGLVTEIEKGNMADHVIECFSDLQKKASNLILT